MTQKLLPELEESVRSTLRLIARLDHEMDRIARSASEKFRKSLTASNPADRTRRRSAPTLGAGSKSRPA